MEPVAFTIRSENLARELKTSVAISEAHVFSEHITSLKGFLQTSALWDTGAMGAVITREAVNKLNLHPITQCKNYHAQGESLVNVYLIDVLLPNNLLIKGVQAAEGILDGCGMLIGMDIITFGDFALTNRNNKSVFSFQIPSTHDYDFVKQIQQGIGQKKPKK